MNRIDEIDVLMRRLGDPFARAFATFIRECLKSETRNGSGALASREDSSAAPTYRFETLDQLPPDLAEEARRMDAAYAELERSGAVGGVEFTADTPARLAGQRLRRVLADKHIKQSELAKRLGISPAVVSRVLKNPDRSMVATLRRIAAAIGVQLHELID